MRITRIVGTAAAVLAIAGIGALAIPAMTSASAAHADGIRVNVAPGDGIRVNAVPADGIRVNAVPADGIRVN